MFNHITIVGHLGRDPEMSYTPTGTAVTKFSVAVSRRWTDKKSGEKQEHTDWFNITAWNQLGETCNSYLHKGSKVLCAGRMESRKYTDKDNVERTVWDLILSDMTMLDGAGQNGAERGKGTEADPNSDIPF